MSLLLVKTKNLSWQDHTLNIEVMMSPQGSSLLMNKHKALDAKLEREKLAFEKQRESRIKDFVIEKRLVLRQRQKLLRRSLELAEERSKSAVLKPVILIDPAQISVRSMSAPALSRKSTLNDKDSLNMQTSGIAASAFPKIPLKGAALFAATLQKSSIYSESSSDGDNEVSSKNSPVLKDEIKPIEHGVFLTELSLRPLTLSSPQSTSVPKENKDITAPTSALSFASSKVPSVRFSHETEPRIEVSLRAKTIDDKVKNFLLEQESFNSRPSKRSAGSPRPSRAHPLVAQRHRTLHVDSKLLEKSFDKYCEHRSYDDLLKAMKLAAKLKSQVKQARNTSFIPSIAAFKSTRSFIQLLKRKKRTEKDETPQNIEQTE